MDHTQGLTPFVDRHHGSKRQLMIDRPEKNLGTYVNISS